MGISVMMCEELVIYKIDRVINSRKRFSIVLAHVFCYVEIRKLETGKAQPTECF
jgi:hypothetical protein